MSFIDELKEEGLLKEEDGMTLQSFTASPAAIVEMRRRCRMVISGKLKGGDLLSQGFNYFGALDQLLSSIIDHFNLKEEE